jgi:hypothetical protein
MLPAARIIAPLLILPIVLAADAPPPADTMILPHPPPGIVGFEPDAPDYVAVMMTHEVYGHHPDEQVSVARSGPWVRHERVRGGTTMVEIGNYAAGAEVAFSVDARGYRSLTLARETAPGPGQTLTRTDRADQAIGERCTVWTTRIGPDPSWGPIEEDCLTADGIPLWSRVGDGKGTVFSEMRMTSLTRRPVRPEEAMPPRALFTWSNWAQPTPDRPANPREATNYDLQLLAPPSSADDPVPSRHVLRRGDAILTDERSRLGHIVTFRSPALRLDYRDGSRRDLARLGVQIVDAGDKHPEDFGERPLGKTETILGLSCADTDTAFGVTDMSAGACITADGIELASWRSSWGSALPTYRATALRRGGVSDADIIPPAGLLDWDRWLGDTVGS